MLKQHTIVIGGGISGLACATRLAEAGQSVCVLDKARGPGGRMASRRGPRDSRFDHGPQYFTSRRLAFSLAVDAWRSRGLVTRYNASVAQLEHGGFRMLPGAGDRYAGHPGMTSVCKHLAEGLDYRPGQRAVACRHNGRDWAVELETGETLYTPRLVITAPPAQAVALLGDADPLAKQAGEARMHGQWSLMLGLDTSLELPFEAAVIDNPVVSWAAQGRSPGGFVETWVVHAGFGWSARNMERSADEVAGPLAEEFASALGRPGIRPAHAEAFRWRYSLPAKALRLPEEMPYLFDEARHLGLCGDWCLEGRIEAAWTSGHHLGDRLALGV